MSDDHTQWFIYADENLAVARLALDSGFYNACLQNYLSVAIPLCFIAAALRRPHFVSLRVRGLF